MKMTPKMKSALKMKTTPNEVDPKNEDGIKNEDNTKQAGVELGLTQAETVSPELDLIKGLIKAMLGLTLQLRKDLTLDTY